MTNLVVMITLLGFAITYQVAYYRQRRHNQEITVQVKQLERCLISAYATMEELERTCLDAAKIVEWADTGVYETENTNV